MARRRRNDSGLEGILLVDKPTGMTSHDVVAKLRRALGTRTIGHTGTLDPFASGLMVVVVGRYTRLSAYLTDADKRYQGEVSFGRSTTTDDLEGETLATGDPAGLDEERVREATRAFVGTIRQRPPAFSAISVDGERLYKKARRGEEVDVPEREVTVHRFELEAFADARAHVDVACSKGTYIRALARDLGAALGVPAHLSALRRTASGAYAVDEALPLDDLMDPERARGALTLGPQAIRGIPVVQVERAGAADLRQGRQLSWPGAAADVALAFEGDEPVALVRIVDGAMQVLRGFGAAQTVDG